MLLRAGVTCDYSLLPEMRKGEFLTGVAREIQLT